jgi:anti-sigma factor RsiW
LDFYLEGELNESGRREIEGHLARCPACREALEGRRLLLGAFSSLPPLPVPSDFAVSVVSRLPAARGLAFGWFVAAISSTLTFLTLLLGYYLATGKSLTEMLLPAGRFCLAAVSQVVPLLAKLFKLAGLAVKMAVSLVTAVLKGLEIVSTSIGPEIRGGALLLGLVLASLILFGMKRILSPGEKT